METTKEKLAALRDVASRILKDSARHIGHTITGPFRYLQPYKGRENFKNDVFDMVEATGAPRPTSVAGLIQDYSRWVAKHTPALGVRRQLNALKDDAKTLANSPVITKAKVYEDTIRRILGKNTEKAEGEPIQKSAASAPLVHRVAAGELVSSDGLRRGPRGDRLAFWGEGTTPEAFKQAIEQATTTRPIPLTNPGLITDTLRRWVSDYIYGNAPDVRKPTNQDPAFSDPRKYALQNNEPVNKPANKASDAVLGNAQTAVGRLVAKNLPESASKYLGIKTGKNVDVMPDQYKPRPKSGPIDFGAAPVVDTPAKHREKQMDWAYNHIPGYGIPKDYNQWSLDNAEQYGRQWYNNFAHRASNQANEYLGTLRQLPNAFETGVTLNDVRNYWNDLDRRLNSR